MTLSWSVSKCLTQRFTLKVAVIDFDMHSASGLNTFLMAMAFSEHPVHVSLIRGGYYEHL